MLQAVTRQLQFAEDCMAQGDISFDVTERNSQEFYDGLKDTFDGARTTPLPDQNDVIGPTKRHVRWVYDPAKARYRSEVLRATPLPGDIIDTVYSGGKVTSYHPYLKTANTETGDVELPKESWLMLMRIARKPVSQAISLPGATYKGHQTVGGDDCLMLSVPYSDGTLDIWLSVANGYRAERMSYTCPLPENKQAYSVTEVKSFLRQPLGLLVPEKGQYSRFITDESGNKRWMTSDEWTVTSYSATPADASFKLSMAAGTKIRDISTGTLIETNVEN